MARITLRQLLDHAAEYGYGVPAFNINNMEQGLAIMQAAAETSSPVIMQASRGARGYAGDIMLRNLIDSYVEMYPDIPVCMHQDHGNSDVTCLSAIRHGFTSVMMDGSLEADGKTPASYEYNVHITKKVSEFAHMVGVSVEGELGVLGSLETGEGEKEDGHGGHRRGCYQKNNCLRTLIKRTILFLKPVLMHLPLRAVHHMEHTNFRVNLMVIFLP